MIRIYYVEIKSYWQDELGTDYQIADAGVMPLVSTNETKALDLAKQLEKRYIEDYSYQVTIPDSKYPCKKTNCLYAVRMEKKERRMRMEIKVYLTSTC